MVSHDLSRANKLSKTLCREDVCILWLQNKFEDFLDFKQQSLNQLFLSSTVPWTHVNHTIRCQVVSYKSQKMTILQQLKESLIMWVKQNMIHSSYMQIVVPNSTPYKEIKWDLKVAVWDSLWAVAVTPKTRALHGMINSTSVHQIPYYLVQSVTLLCKATTDKLNQIYQSHMK